MKKILGLSLALIMVVGLIGVQTFAVFSNNGPSSGNSFASGTLALKTNELDGVTQTLYATNMSPGAAVGPATITLKNVGTVNGAALNIVFTYVKSDGSTSVVKTADEVAALMEVDTLTYGGADLLALVPNTNSTSYKDIQDVSTYFIAGNTHQQAGINGSDSKAFVIKVHLIANTGNDYQGHGINVTMAFTLQQ